MKTNYISEAGYSVLSERRQAKLIGITKKESLFPPQNIMIGMFGFFIGIFLGIIILKPELINWRVFNQAFILGVITSFR